LDGSIADGVRGNLQSVTPLGEAFLWARRSGRPVPAVVLDYLERAGQRISLAARHAVPKKGQTAKTVYEALEFKVPGRTGATNSLAAISDQKHRLEVAATVSLALDRTRQHNVQYGVTEKLNQAADEVVTEHPLKCERCRNKGISKSTVLRCYYDYEHLFSNDSLGHSNGLAPGITELLLAWRDPSSS
jgi:hypothetical protein